MGDLLSLDATHAVRVLATDVGHRAEPVTASGGEWVRSAPGDGAGLALLHRLRNRTAVEDGFRVNAHSEVPLENETERAMGVDQTHASWVVGDRVVVKWMTEPLVGPHPAADRLRRLSERGFAESPALVGVIEWLEPGGHWVPVVIVQEFLSESEDGWTWSLADARRALGLVPDSGTSGFGAGFGADLGEVVGRLHLALADDPPERMPAELARQYAEESLVALDSALRLLERNDRESFDLLSAHRSEVEAVLAALADVEGTPVLPAHGDLHVGQVLRDPGGHYALVDFDGNPTLPPGLRAARAPAARDVAEMLASMENVEHVVRHYAPDLSDEAGRAWTAGEQSGFLEGYRRALGTRTELFDDALLGAYDWEQVCREIVYAGERDFTEWYYVPAAQLRRRLVPGA